MKNFKILTKRHFQNWPSWHLVYEWEDIFSSLLEIPIMDAKKKESRYENRYVKKLLTITPTKQIAQKIFSLFKSSEKHIAFELLLKNNFSYTNNVNAVPLIIDYWDKDVKALTGTYKNCKLIGISSLEVFNYLKANNCPLNIKHLALSLPDKYKVEADTTYTKKYDIILAGRKNKLLWGFMLEFEKKFPDIEFLYQENVNGELFYKSNKSGIIGNFHTRQEYIDLLRLCRIGFYSTPGMDTDENRTGGFNPVTPRYLELIASGCLLLGRYPDNDETRYYELEEYCKLVNDYDQFEETILKYLAAEGPDMKKYAAFLNKHYTSNRAYQLKEYLEETFK